ncbi:DegT/DnrJ/EryC1/StrS family aminotransferase [Rhizobium ruizarguesonis]|uniref:DegT/DnrJ/EryC1/StrS family aminotransferase n=1 Tax=Rhizobium ruizarguesonis TaxID=2081791 RepID=UPI00102FC762|nr:DegT/DnrJ/EryC1/StrS family aminotransferase [Rhizobium ruizarguesonis]TBA11994.1 DegT/DnrJ/EryC1/StrS family aminotransferase [Rhizobium ruizarguesonis]
MAVAFYDNKLEIADILNFSFAELHELLCSPDIIDGASVRDFEADIRDWTGAQHAIAVNNATDGLMIALAAAGIGPGDEVIVPCYSFFATASSVVHVGAMPVFVDIDPQTYALDIDKIQRAITQRTKAIMPVHLFSQMADMPKLTKLAHEHGLLVVEDSAEAMGMYQYDQHAGTIGDIGVFSFFPTKTLGALGDAGMIITQNVSLAEKCRAIANLRDGQAHAGHFRILSRMDDWQAIVLRQRLNRLDGTIGARNANARRLTQLLSLVKGVQTPVFVDKGYGSSAVYYVYLIEAERRDELAAYLARHHVAAETYYPLALHLQPVFRQLGYVEGDFPHAERASKRALGLPMHPELKEPDVQEIARLIGAFYGDNP